jgi:hypothetical protein
MKFAIVLVSLLFGTVSYAAEGALTGVEDIPAFKKSCSGLRLMNDGDQVVCWGTDGAREIMRAKVGDKISTPTTDMDIWDAIQLGVLPDDSTSVMYSYQRALINGTTGKKIGVMYIDGYQNSEMEVRVKITTRLNNKGRLVSIKVESIYP